MNFFVDFFDFLLRCFHGLIIGPKRILLIAIILSLLIAGINLLFLLRYHKLWNKEFNLSFFAQLICFLVYPFTFFIIFSIISLANLEPIASSSISQWRNEIIHDSQWSKNVFKKAYWVIYDKKYEDFTNYLCPEKGGRIIPSSNPKTIEAIAEIYSDESRKHFIKNSPFYSMFIWPKNEIANDSIRNDMKVFFALDKGQTYNLHNSIDIAANRIRADLYLKIPIIIIKTRLFLILLFLFIESLLLIIIGIKAYTEIRSSII